MFRRVSFALIALVLASTACPCHATAVIFSAQIGTLNTDYQGESIVWLGGLLAGSLNIMDTPYLINTNSVTGEVVGRYKFINHLLDKPGGAAINLLVMEYISDRGGDIGSCSASYPKIHR